METIVCSSRTVLALKLVTEMLSVRLGEHEMVEFSLEMDTHPYFNPFFHIWGSTKVALDRKKVRFDAHFFVDLQTSKIDTREPWWLDPNYGAGLEVEDEKFRAFWSQKNKIWFITGISNDSETGWGSKVRYRGTDSRNRWAYDESFKSFCPEI